MPTEMRPKKQVSERRRMQNKQAQKTYRKPSVWEIAYRKANLMFGQESVEKGILRSSET